MAADTRPFKSKEQDGHGNEVIVRDQQLVEQTSQTTMASGEYFEIVDVDGRMAKIPKDNMIGVVREALGTLLNGLADQTTVTKALTLNEDTLGASTAATLASVLGAAVVYSGTSLDDLKTPGRYSAPSSIMPDEIVGTIDVIPSAGERFSQICYQPTKRRTLIRTYNGSTWSDWSRSDGFGCATPEALASLLGVPSALNGMIGYFQITPSTTPTFDKWINICTAATSITSASFIKGANDKGILFVGVGGSNPSIFSFSRTAVTAVYEGGVQASNISISEGNTTITVTKSSGSQMKIIWFSV